MDEAIQRGAPRTEAAEKLKSAQDTRKQGMLLILQSRIISMFLAPEGNSQFLTFVHNSQEFWKKRDFFSGLRGRRPLLGTLITGLVHENSTAQAYAAFTARTVSF